MEELKFKHWFNVQGTSPRLEFPETYRKEFENKNGRKGYIVIYWEDEEKIDISDQRLYFKVYISVMEKHDYFWGMSKHDIHHEMMKMVFGETTIIDGKETLVYPHFQDLNKRQFKHLLKRVKEFMEYFLDLEPLEPRRLKFN